MFNLLEKYLFNKILAGVVLTSVFLSFFLEYALNLIPCKLCLYQRYVWISLLLLCTLNLLLKNNKKFIEMMILITLAIILFLSFYHSGIELNLFKNVISCNFDSNNLVNSIEELDFMIKNTPNINCAFPKFRILNLSLSNLSFIFSSVLFLLSLKVYKKSIFN